MSCTILYYILSLCLHVLSMGLKDLKLNFFIFIFCIKNKLFCVSQHLEKKKRVSKFKVFW